MASRRRRERRARERREEEESGDDDGGSLGSIHTPSVSEMEPRGAAARRRKEADAPAAARPRAGADEQEDGSDGPYSTGSSYTSGSGSEYDSEDSNTSLSDDADSVSLASSIESWEEDALDARHRLALEMRRAGERVREAKKVARREERRLLREGVPEELAIEQAAAAADAAVARARLLPPAVVRAAQAAAEPGSRAEAAAAAAADRVESEDEAADGDGAGAATETARPPILSYEQRRFVRPQPTRRERRAYDEVRRARALLPKSQQLMLWVAENDMRQVRALLDAEEERQRSLVFSFGDSKDKAKICDVNTADEGAGLTPLIIAVRGGFYDMVEYLLSRSRTNSNQADGFGMTPLAHAAACGRLEIAKLLIAKGSQVYAVDLESWTPLTHACQNGHLIMVEYLLARKSDPTTVTGQGETPLMVAASNGHADVVEHFILNTDVDINQTDKRGNTALCLAASHGHAHVVRTLVLNFANTRIKNSDGETVLDVVPSSFATRNYRRASWLLAIHRADRERRRHFDTERRLLYERELATARALGEELKPEAKKRLAALHAKVPAQVEYPPAALPAKPGAARAVLQRFVRLVVKQCEMELDYRERVEAGDDPASAYGADDDAAADAFARVETPRTAREASAGMSSLGGGAGAAGVGDADTKTTGSWLRDHFAAQHARDKDHKKRVLPRLKAEVFRREGDDLMVQGRFDVAMTLYQTARRFAKTDPLYRRAFEAAAFHLDTVKVEQSAVAAKESRVAHHKAEVNFATGSKMFEQGDWMEATRYFKMALMDDENNERFRASYERAVDKHRSALREARRRRRARERASQAAADDPRTTGKPRERGWLDSLLSGW